MGKAIDITGQKFGKLVPIYRVQNHKNNAALWHCKCDCGNEKDVTGGNLRAGNVTSCGCIGNDVGIDLTDQRFGRLTVIKKIKSKKNRGRLWECQCDCGKMVNVRSQALRSGHVKSCGCLKAEIETGIIGKRFGRLLVLEKDRIEKHEVYYWCKCDCGKTKSISYCALISGNTISCGCYRKEKMIQKRTLDLTNQKFGRLTAIKIVNADEYGNNIWLCNCECGSIAYVKASLLYNGWTQSCGCIRSAGEEKIAAILSQNNINYEREYIFSDCIFSDTNAKARYDFYINHYYCLEYDGIIHYQYFENSWNTQDKLKKIKEHDKIKDNYCKEHNIPLIRIPYTQFDNLCIEDLLLESSKFRVI